jgi:hypothetical protein
LTNPLVSDAPCVFTGAPRRGCQIIESTDKWGATRERASVDDLAEVVAANPFESYAAVPIQTSNTAVIAADVTIFMSISFG